MMEILGFIFSDFWVWCGFCVLIYTVAVSVEHIANAMRGTRTVKIDRFEDGRQVITIENATNQDTADAICAVRGTVENNEYE